MKRRLAAAARSHPATGVLLARLFRHIGLTRVAARLERAADVAVVRPPGGRSFSMARCEGRDQVVAAVSAGGWDRFEPPLPAVLAAILRRQPPGATFADIGANTGYYSLLAASVAPGLRIDAFEPYPPVLDVLRRNVSINRESRIAVHGVAVGAEPGRSRLFVPVAAHGLVETSSSLNPDFALDGVGGSVDVDVTTLDDWYGAAGRVPTVLKIDVESFEPEVIRGAAALLERERPLLIVELLPHADPSSLEELRTRFGYVDIRLRSDAAVVGPDVARDEDAWNHLWCPAAGLAGITGLLESAGVVVAA